MESSFSQRASAIQSMRFSTNSNDDEASDAGFAPGVRELDLDALCCPCCLPELHDNNYMALGDEPGGEGGQLGNNRPGQLKSTGQRKLFCHRLVCAVLNAVLYIVVLALTAVSKGADDDDDDGVDFYTGEGDAAYFTNQVFLNIASLALAIFAIRWGCRLLDELDQERYANEKWKIKLVMVTTTFAYLLRIVSQLLLWTLKGPEYNYILEGTVYPYGIYQLPEFPPFVILTYALWPSVKELRGGYYLTRLARPSSQRQHRREPLSQLAST